MILAEHNHRLLNRDQGVVYVTTTTPIAQRCPAVLILHGFKGFRNWGFFPAAAQQFAQDGVIAVRMDTSMNGMGGTNDAVIDLEAFANNTISQEVADVMDVIPQLSELLGSQWNGDLHIVGHSRGGGVAQVAMRTLIHQPIPGVRLMRSVVWNCIGKWIRWTPRQRASWEQLGYMEFENSRTHQMLRMSFDYVNDIEENSEGLDLVTAAKTSSKLLLYIHASMDVTVPIAEIEELRSAAGNAGPLIVIDGSTHTFGMSHPVTHITESFAQALQHTITWIKSETQYDAATR